MIPRMRRRPFHLPPTSGAVAAAALSPISKHGNKGEPGYRLLHPGTAGAAVASRTASTDPAAQQAYRRYKKQDKLGSPAAYASALTASTNPAEISEMTRVALTDRRLTVNDRRVVRAAAGNRIREINGQSPMVVPERPSDQDLRLIGAPEFPDQPDDQFPHADTPVTDDATPDHDHDGVPDHLDPDAPQTGQAASAAGSVRARKPARLVASLDRIDEPSPFDLPDAPSPAPAPAGTQDADGPVFENDGDRIVLRGTVKGDDALKPDRPWLWSGREKAWVLPRNLKPETRQSAIKAYRAKAAAAGVTVPEPGSTDTAALTTEQKAARLRDRAAAASARADKQRAAADASVPTADERDFMSLMEPVKIGHHSQRRHEKFNERMRNKAQKGYEASEAARRADEEARRLTEQADRLERDPNAERKWTSADFKPGDFAVDRFDTPHEIVRVNAKTVTVKTPYSWTDTLPYGKIKGRIGADGKRDVAEPVEDTSDYGIAAREMRALGRKTVADLAAKRGLTPEQTEAAQVAAERGMKWAVSAGRPKHDRDKIAEQAARAAVNDAAPDLVPVTRFGSGSRFAPKPEADPDDAAWSAAERDKLIASVGSINSPALLDRAEALGMTTLLPADRQAVQDALAARRAELGPTSEQDRSDAARRDLGLPTDEQLDALIRAAAARSDAAEAAVAGMDDTALDTAAADPSDVLLRDAAQSEKHRRGRVRIAQRRVPEADQARLDLYEAELADPSRYGPDTPTVAALVAARRAELDSPAVRDIELWALTNEQLKDQLDSEDTTPRAEAERDRRLRLTGTERKADERERAEYLAARSLADRPVIDIDQALADDAAKRARKAKRKRSSATAVPPAVLAAPPLRTPDAVVADWRRRSDAALTPEQADQVLAEFRASGDRDVLPATDLGYLLDTIRDHRNALQAADSPAVVSAPNTSGELAGQQMIDAGRAELRMIDQVLDAPSAEQADQTLDLLEAIDNDRAGITDQDDPRAGLFEQARRAEQTAAQARKAAADARGEANYQAGLARQSAGADPADAMFGADDGLPISTDLFGAETAGTDPQAVRAARAARAADVAERAAADAQVRAEKARAAAEAAPTERSREDVLAGLDALGVTIGDPSDLSTAELEQALAAAGRAEGNLNYGFGDPADIRQAADARRRRSAAYSVIAQARWSRNPNNPDAAPAVPAEPDAPDAADLAAGEADDEQVADLMRRLASAGSADELTDVLVDVTDLAGRGGIDDDLAGMMYALAEDRETELAGQRAADGLLPGLEAVPDDAADPVPALPASAVPDAVLWSEPDQETLVNRVETATDLGPLAVLRREAETAHDSGLISAQTYLRTVIAADAARDRISERLAAENDARRNQRRRSTLSRTEEDTAFTAVDSQQVRAEIYGMDGKEELAEFYGGLNSRKVDEAETRLSQRGLRRAMRDDRAAQAGEYAETADTWHAARAELREQDPAGFAASQADMLRRISAGEPVEMELEAFRELAAAKLLRGTFTSPVLTVAGKELAGVGGDRRRRENRPAVLDQAPAAAPAPADVPADRVLETVAEGAGLPAGPDREPDDAWLVEWADEMAALLEADDQAVDLIADGVPAAQAVYDPAGAADRTARRRAARPAGPADPDAAPAGTVPARAGTGRRGRGRRPAALPDRPQAAETAGVPAVRRRATRPAGPPARPRLLPTRPGRVRSLLPTGPAPVRPDRPVFGAGPVGLPDAVPGTGIGLLGPEPGDIGPDGLVDESGVPPRPAVLPPRRPGRRGLFARLFRRPARPDGLPARPSRFTDARAAFMEAWERTDPQSAENRARRQTVRNARAAELAARRAGGTYVPALPPAPGPAAVPAPAPAPAPSAAAPSSSVPVPGVRARRPRIVPRAEDRAAAARARVALQLLDDRESTLDARVEAGSIEPAHARRLRAAIRAGRTRARNTIRAVEGDEAL